MAGGLVCPPAIALCRVLCGAIWILIIFYEIFRPDSLAAIRVEMSACVCQKPTLAIIKPEVK